MAGSPGQTATTEVLAGLVERVTFHNAETGFWRAAGQGARAARADHRSRARGDNCGRRVLLRWSGNEAMSFFGLLIPPPFAPFSKPAHHLVGEAHNVIAWTIIVCAAGHAAAALFHHFILRDDVLWRMLPGRHARQEEVRAPSPEQAAQG